MLCEKRQKGRDEGGEVHGEGLFATRVWWSLYFDAAKGHVLVCGPFATGVFVEVCGPVVTRAHTETWDLGSRLQPCWSLGTLSHQGSTDLGDLCCHTGPCVYWDQSVVKGHVWVHGFIVARVWMDACGFCLPLKAMRIPRVRLAILVLACVQGPWCMQIWVCCTAT